MSAISCRVVQCTLLQCTLVCCVWCNVVKNTGRQGSAVHYRVAQGSAIWYSAFKNCSISCIAICYNAFECSAVQLCAVLAIQVVEQFISGWHLPSPVYSLIPMDSTVGTSRQVCALVPIGTLQNCNSLAKFNQFKQIFKKNQ